MWPVIPRKATEHYFSVSLFIVLYKMVLTRSSLRIKSYILPFNQIKATDQYFPLVLFIVLNEVVLTIESVDQILKCDNSNESCY